jgi:TPR repeat protein
MKKGGAAKGELVLAIYELGNCFRHGWGVAKDPVAARSYYETAANLGDVDALNEVARAYEEGFGGKKDRVSELQIPPRGLRTRRLLCDPPLLPSPSPRGGRRMPRGTLANGERKGMFWKSRWAAVPLARARG